MRLWRLVLLAAATASVACSDPFAVPTVVPDRAALFDEVWRQFDLHYSFFELKNINWDSLGARYRPLALAAPTDYAFALVVARMLAELEDVHVSISPAGSGSTLRYMSRCDTMPTYFSSHVVFERYVPISQLTPGGHLRYGMATPSVGYIYIPDFEGNGWASEMDAAIRGLPFATRLVVDVRNNGGGNYNLAVDIAGRFADETRTYGYIKRRNGPAHDAFTGFTAERVEPVGQAHFGGPVYVLSNRRDFSSAEDFILAMRTFPNVRIVGDTTAGASGGPIVRELANGWTYQLSEWIEYTRAHETFEGIGLAPDVFVKASAAETERGIDPVIARALLAAEAAPSGVLPAPTPTTGTAADSGGFEQTTRAIRGRLLPIGRHEP